MKSAIFAALLSVAMAQRGQYYPQEQPQYAPRQPHGRAPHVPHDPRQSAKF